MSNNNSNNIEETHGDSDTSEFYIEECLDAIDFHVKMVKATLKDHIW